MLLPRLLPSPIQGHFTQILPKARTGLKICQALLLIIETWCWDFPCAASPWINKQSWGLLLQGFKGTSPTQTSALTPLSVGIFPLWMFFLSLHPPIGFSVSVWFLSHPVLTAELPLLGLSSPRCGWRGQVELWPWGDGFALDGFAGGGGGWLEGRSCCCPAGPRGSLVSVPTLVAPAPAPLAARPAGCLAWAHLCIPKNRRRDNNSLLFLQEQVSPGPHLARAQWLL